jgi:hypothetical protein
MNYFLVKVKFTKQLENGTFKRVTEPYLMQAVSFTDAEAMAHEHVGAIVKGEFKVVAIQTQEFEDIFLYEDSETWYKVKVSYMSATEESDKEKQVSKLFLVTAASVKEANDRIKEQLSSMIVDFEIKSVTESPIVDIFSVENKII